MSHSTLLRATLRRAGATAILDLEGDIDAHADAPLQQAWEDALATAPPPARLLLNLARVEYINSTGIAVIVALMAQARRAGLPLLVCNLSEHYAEIFRITRLADYMAVFLDEAAALAATRDN